MKNETPVALSTPPAYFEGGCPVCSHEVARYQRQLGGDRLTWVDVAHGELAAGLTLPFENTMGSQAPAVVHLFTSA